MLIGIIFYKYISKLSPLLPILISLMLFITYSKVSLNDLRIKPFHYTLLAVQYVGSIIVYLLIKPLNEIVAQGTMICILASTATSAPVVTGLLGGNISITAGYAFISNISLAFVAPIFFSSIRSTSVQLPFLTSFWHIFFSVMPILILPFILALILRKISPKINSKIQQAQIISFYLWAIALTVVISSVTNYVISLTDGTYKIEIILALLSLAICISQFLLGRKVGTTYGLTVTGGQSLGQKNTILAIWLTQTYLNPLATVGPGTYVLWQNIVNSWQLWKHNNTKQNS